MDIDTIVSAWLPSLDAISANEWNALIPGSPEDWQFYRAVEDAPPEGFAVAALTVRDAQGDLLAAAPCFSLDYRLDTPFQGALRNASEALNRWRPGATSMKVVGLGSPLSDGCSIGFRGDLDASQQTAVLLKLVERLSVEATVRGANIIALKGLAGEARDYHDALVAKRFGRIKSVPIAVLPMPHADLGTYLASLKRQHRSYFRNKLKTLPQIRIELVRSAKGLEHRLVALYEATLQQSGVSYGDFDRIGPGYFARFLARQEEKAQLMLFWRDDELVSFHLFHVGDHRLISNKMGMRYPDARELNLYFINWLKLIEIATASGITEIEMGATTYAAKLLFGARLERRWIYFRFRNAIANTIAQPFYGLFDFEGHDLELKKLRREGRLPAIYEGKEIADRP